MKSIEGFIKPQTRQMLLIYDYLWQREAVFLI